MTDAIDSARKFIDATQDPNEWPLSPTWVHRAHLVAVLAEAERMRAVVEPLRRLLDGARTLPGCMSLGPIEHDSNGAARDCGECDACALAAALDEVDDD